MASKALREHRQKMNRERRRKGQINGYDFLIPFLAIVSLLLLVAGIGISWYEGGNGGALAGSLGLAGIVVGIGTFFMSRLVIDHTESFIRPAQVGGVIGICAAAFEVILYVSGLF